MIAKETVILGIDPGTQVMGYGILMAVGKKLTLLDLGVLRLTSIKESSTKLNEIYQQTIRLIDDFLPDELAIEAPFYGKNPQSMLKLGRAQGVAIAAAISRQVPVTEYAPKKIKAVVGGSGAASKEKVAAMLPFYIEGLPKEKIVLDATDALAAAVCHFYSMENAGKEKEKYSSWADFAKKRGLE